MKDIPLEIQDAIRLSLHHGNNDLQKWICDVADSVVPAWEKDCPKDDTVHKTIMIAHAYLKGKVNDNQAIEAADLMQSIAGNRLLSNGSMAAYSSAMAAVLAIRTCVNVSRQRYKAPVDKDPSELAYEAVLSAASARMQSDKTPYKDIVGNYLNILVNFSKVKMLSYHTKSLPSY